MASRSLAALLAIAALTACNPQPVADAGTDAPIAVDTPPPPPYVCESAPMVVNGVMGETETITFDTSMTDERPRDLGLACGNPSGEGVRWARQEVIEYHVPGTGPVAVEIDTINDVTPREFNTVVQIRSACTEIPDQFYPPTCLEDASTTDPRATGGFQAMGGDTLYLFVTGYSDPPPIDMEIDEGPLQIELTPRANTPPSIDSGAVIFNPASTSDDPPVIITVNATDAEGPVVAFAFQLFTAAGQVDFDGDGDGDADDIFIFPWESVTGSGPYRATTTITAAQEMYTIGAFCRDAGCTEAGISVLDAQFAASAFTRVPFAPPEPALYGEACDGVSTVCTRELTCSSGTCAIGARMMLACTNATEIVIDEPTDATPTTATVSGALNRGVGAAFAPCSSGSDPEASSVGREAIYYVDITTAGTYRLDLTTALPGTGTRNTLIYVRGAECGDNRPSNSLGCNDDISSSVRQSELSIEVTEGRYYVFVEFFDGVMTASAAYDLQATLTLIP